MKPPLSVGIPEIKGYKNLRLIRSQGGMSYIYHGTHIERGQEVIIKLMPAPKNEHEALKFRQLFDKEILIARLSVNDHLLAAIDHGDIPMRGSDHPRPYLVYPYIKHGSLADLVAVEKLWETWELPHIVDIITQAAEGLFHLHKSGVVHQDVKPNNLLWMPTDPMRNPLHRIHVWLIDFGAAEPERKGKSKDIKGTLKYIAPEQLDGDIKYSVDQYALALVARLLLTGLEPPSINEPVTPLFARPTHLNTRRLFEPEIDQVLFKALAPHPQDRFPSVIAFAQALQKAILKQIQQTLPTTLADPSVILSQQQAASFSLRSVSLLQEAALTQMPIPIVPEEVPSPPLLPVVSDAVSLPLSVPVTSAAVSLPPSMPVTSVGQIFLPPLNSPKPYEPPRPKGSAQPRIPARTKNTGLTLPAVPAQKYFTVRLPDTLRMLAWSPNGTELACTFYHGLPLLVNVNCLEYPPANAPTMNRGATVPPSVSRADINHSVETFPRCAHAHSACWSPDGRFLAFSIYEENDARAEICICDRMAPKEYNRLLVFHRTEPVRGLDWSPRGLFAIWVEHKLLVYDLSNISTEKHLPDPSYALPLGDTMYCDQLTTLRWSPNGEWLAAGSNNGQLVCWQPSTARYFKGHPLKKNIRSISWSPDSRALVVAFAGKQVLFWNLHNGQTLRAEVPENPRMVSVSPQTGAIAVATERALFFFEHIGALAPTAMHPGQLYAALSPDNKLATLDQYDDKELIIWQV